MTTKAELKNYFENFPTKDQFWNWMDSYWHKEEELPVKHKLSLKTIPFNVSLILKTMILLVFTPI